MKSIRIKEILTGFAAGALNGLLGTGGGIILVTALSKNSSIDKHQVFPCSLAIMLPVSILTLLLTASPEALRYPSLPQYLLGAAVGGFLAQKKPLSLLWLHRLFGILILAGGIRFLCR